MNHVRFDALLNKVQLNTGDVEILTTIYNFLNSKDMAERTWGKNGIFSKPSRYNETFPKDNEVKLQKLWKDLQKTLDDDNKLLIKDFFKKLNFDIYLK